MSSTPPPAAAPPDALGMLRHRWWLVVLATLLGLAAGGGWLAVREPVWESTTSVLVHPAGQDVNVVGGRTQGQVNLDTEAQLVRSTAVADRAAARLFPDQETEPPGETGSELAQRVRVEVPPNTSVLTITFAAPTAHRAQAGARAFAEAYLGHREQAARADLAAQTKAIEAKADELSESLSEINTELAGAPPDTAAAANLQSRRSTVAAQLDTVSGRLDELTTATVTAGTVISEPPLPRTPSRPRTAIVLASAAALGLVLGVAGAVLAERLTRRVHRPADLSRRLGVPVLAALGPATAPRPDEIASPYGPGGRVFDRLRNEVIAAYPAPDPPGSGEGRVVVVTSVRGGAATSLTAANLAASLARCGRETVLVGARTVQTSGGGGFPGLLGVTPAPGLSEVLADRVPVPEALQQPLRHPRLHVMTMGATATGAGLLQSPALRATLATLAAQAQYVVVDAPATTMSADAQGLACHADAALVLVERRRSRLADVADAADQLRQVGTPLLGTILLPPLPLPEPEQEPDPAAGALPEAGALPAPGSPAPGSPAPALPVSGGPGPGPPADGPGR